MSSQQFHELNAQLQNFPAQSLARKIKNTNLNSLRRTLFELNVHEEMMKILKRKYFPQVVDESAAIPVDKHMQTIGLQPEIAEMVRQCLQALGRSEKKEQIRSYKENPEWQSKSEINTKLSSGSDSQPVQDRVSADGETSPDATHVHSLLVGQPETAVGDVTRLPGIQRYIDGLVTRPAKRTRNSQHFWRQ